MTAIASGKKKGKMLRVGMFLWSILRFVIIFGLAFLILKPFVEKIFMAFMSPEDLMDSTVRLIPRHFSVYYWKTAFDGLELNTTFLTTLMMSLSCALVATFFSTMIGYGLARFKFKGSRLAFIVVIVIMLVPPQVYSVAMYLNFVNFLGLNIRLTNTLIPLFLQNIGGMGLKQGLYIYLIMTFFKGMPKDLENAAYIDGASPIKTFFLVMVPNARTIIATVFLFSFCWEWTDTAYPELFFTELSVVANKIPSIFIRVGLTADPLGTSIVQNAACLIILVPLMVLFLLFQKMLIKSIVRTGVAN